MASDSQIRANRANAMKSTGPRSVEGKAVSRFNALKHGMDAASVVLPGEDPAEYQAMVADYEIELQPATPSERFHVDTMIQANWQKQRLLRAQAELYRDVIRQSGCRTLAAALQAETPAGKVLNRVQRQLAAAERDWHRANRELRRLREEREADEAEPEPISSQSELGSLSQFPHSPYKHPLSPRGDAR